MDKTSIQAILDLDIQLQRQIYAGWPASWAELKWPVGSIRALLLLEAGYARTPSEVADVLKVNRTTVTGIIDRLETEALITRRIDAQDKRSFILELTDAGRELVGQIDALRRDQLEQALTMMDDASIEALHHGLTAVTQALHDYQEKSKLEK
jgi:DNA-binding MarR family transcriptional regulator